MYLKEWLSAWEEEEGGWGKGGDYTLADCAPKNWHIMLLAVLEMSRETKLNMRTDWRRSDGVPPRTLASQRIHVVH